LNEDMVSIFLGVDTDIPQMLISMIFIPFRHDLSTVRHKYVAGLQ
jgi:hypothetical protein